MFNLEAAFKSLGQQGLVARQDYCDCQSCGLSAISEVIDKRVAKGKTVAGYVFFHQQDTEAATTSGDLYLAFGAANDDATDAEAEAIGQLIVSTLEQHGFVTEWNGSAGTRIIVKVAVEEFN